MLLDRRDIMLAASTAALAAASAPSSGATPGRPRRSLPDAQTFASITQLMNEWAHEVDTNYGQTMAEADLLTPDCRCKLEGKWISGLEAIAAFYKARFASIQPAGPAPIIRQLLSNFRIMPTGRNEALVGFNLLLFVQVGTVPFTDYCDPVEVADVRANCRRGTDGFWRISMLDSDRIFRRERS